MKKSTKILATVVAVATMFVGVVGCSKKSSGVEGKYTASIDMSEELAEMGIEDVDASMDATLELKDGEFTMTMDTTNMMKALYEAMGVDYTDEDLADAVESFEGEYTLDGDTLTLTVDGEDETATYEDGKIIMDMDGVELVFEK